MQEKRCGGECAPSSTSSSLSLEGKRGNEGRGGVAHAFELMGVTPSFTQGTTRSWVPASGYALEFRRRCPNTTGSFPLPRADQPSHVWRQSCCMKVTCDTEKNVKIQPNQYAQLAGIGENSSTLAVGNWGSIFQRFGQGGVQKTSACRQIRDLGKDLSHAVGGFAGEQVRAVG